jgi:hypothetical protein
MRRTERVAVEELTERRILEPTMRPASRQTRAPSPRQLLADHDYAVSTREYQSDQPSQKLLDRPLVLSSQRKAPGRSKPLLSKKERLEIGAKNLGT